jgi:UDP-3-O-[3-hydroxymyristoyl] glucosamine N-acyltransferase
MAHSIKPLIFLGGSYGLDVFVRVCELTNRPIYGLLDHHFFSNTTLLQDIPVVGSEDTFDFESNKEKYDFFIGASMASGLEIDKIKRQKMIALVNRFNLKCATLIHPQSDVHSSSDISQGCFVGYCTVISGRVTIGEHSQIHSQAGVGHDSKIGSNTILQRRSAAVGFVSVGDNVTVGFGAQILHNHGSVGHNSTIQPGITVLRDVKDNEIVSLAGNNQRRIYSPVVRY